MNAMKREMMKAGMAKPQGADFMDYLDRQARFKVSIGKVRVSEIYDTLWMKMNRWLNGRKLYFDDINGDNMQAFEAWMKSQGNCLNTISSYFRAMRAVYNKGVEEGLFEAPRVSPFKHVYTGIAKTVKRAIPITRVKYIANLNFDEMPGLHKATKKSLEYARDMFMFSFYTRGMSFVDMCYLKKSDLKNGYLVYCRRKTGQQLFIKWEDCMEDIRKKHSASEGSPYLLDLLDTDADLRNCLKRKQFSINYALKKIGELAGVGNTLTMYVARHSWASACKNSNIPLSVISEGMGHDNEETTRIYLAQLDTSIVDKANRKIIKQVAFPKTRN